MLSAQYKNYNFASLHLEVTSTNYFYHIYSCNICKMTDKYVIFQCEYKTESILNSMKALQGAVLYNVWNQRNLVFCR